jgi:hypothetical protein
MREKTFQKIPSSSLAHIHKLVLLPFLQFSRNSLPCSSKKNLKNPKRLDSKQDVFHLPMHSLEWKFFQILPLTINKK